MAAPATEGGVKRRSALDSVGRRSVGGGSASVVRDDVDPEALIQTPPRVRERRERLQAAAAVEFAEPAPVHQANGSRKTKAQLKEEAKAAAAALAEKKRLEKQREEEAEAAATAEAAAKLAEAEAHAAAEAEREERRAKREAARLAREEEIAREAAQKEAEAAALAAEKQARKEERERRRREREEQEEQERLEAERIRQKEEEERQRAEAALQKEQRRLARQQAKEEEQRRREQAQEEEERRLKEEAERKKAEQEQRRREAEQKRIEKEKERERLRLEKEAEALAKAEALAAKERARIEKEKEKERLREQERQEKEKLRLKREKEKAIQEKAHLAAERKALREREEEEARVAQQVQERLKAARSVQVQSIGKKSPRKPPGQRVAQLVSRYEVAPTGIPSPVATSELSVPDSTPVVAAAISVPPPPSPIAPTLSREEAAALSARLDALAVGAITCVVTDASAARKRPFAAVSSANERAKAWSSRRQPTHSSFRDLLASHGIVRSDAGNETVASVMDAMPSAVGEIGDEGRSTPPPVAQPVSHAGSSIRRSPAFSRLVIAVPPLPSDSGVSDSEDEPAPSRLSTKESASKMESPKVGVHLVPQASDEELKPLSTIQTRIAEIKKKFGAATASDQASELQEEDAAPQVSNPLGSLMQQMDAHKMDASLHLGGGRGSFGGESDDAGSSVLLQSLHAVEPHDISLGLNQQDYAPGLFTVELNTPERQAALAGTHKSVLPTSQDDDAVDDDSEGDAKEHEESAAPQLHQFSAFMEGSFLNGVSDSEAYNTLDGQKALMAAQFLEHIPLNGSNVSMLHVTLPVVEDDADVAASPDPIENVTPLSGPSSAPSASPSKKKKKFGGGGSGFRPRIGTSPAVSNGVAPPSVLPSAPVASSVPIVSSEKGSRLLKQHRKRVPSGAGPAGEETDATRKVQKLTTTNSIMGSISSAPSIANTATTVTSTADKLEQAKQRRERLAEEERRKREEATRQREQREQRARALKEGSTKPPVAMPPAGGTESATKKAIMEKGKLKAEKLARLKAEEARRNKSTQQPQPASAATSNILTPQKQQQQQQSSSMPAPSGTLSAAESKKGGIFQAFKLLKQKQEQRAASEHAKNHATLSVSNQQPQVAPVAPHTPVPLSKKSSLLPSAPSSDLRPSPLRKRVLSPEKPEVQAVNTTQYSISPCKESDNEANEGSARKKGKREARWARREVLNQVLQQQRLQDADSVFGGPIGLTCTLSEVFEDYKPRKKYQVRTSSAQWSDVGQNKMPSFKK